jgi:hypothetical protein
MLNIMECLHSKVVGDFMKEILPVPVDEAKRYLNDEKFERYKKSFDSFYSPDPCHGLIDFTLRELPKDCDAAKNLAIKRYQIVSKNFDLSINEKRELIKNTSNPKLKSSLIDIIQVFEHSKEEFRKMTIKEYGIEIPV